MSPLLVITVVLGYFGLLFLISLFTSKDSSSSVFFTANRNSPWYLVAYGMVGVALSGITFISVPGDVANTGFTYFNLVIGYAVGIWIIAVVFLPLYYRMKLITIYMFLKERYGVCAYKAGAVMFMIAQLFIASFRLFLMAGVLQLAFFDAYHIPFEITVLATVLLIWLYTFRSGIKTVIITDLLQTTLLLAAVALSIGFIVNALDLSFGETVEALRNHPKSRMFDWNFDSDRFFPKLFLTGVFLTIVNNALDHSVMQKHLTCPNYRESRKNMFWWGAFLLAANFLFLCLGLLLVIYAERMGIPLPESKDDLYPLLALNEFGALAGIVFLLGISAAAYSSADSALTGLTTSFCVDILGFTQEDRQGSQRIRTLTHLGFAGLLFVTIVLFNRLNNDTVINSFIRISGYTFGPLLGLFLFGMFTRIRVKDRAIPYLCALSPLLSLLLYFTSEKWLWGYKFGFEILMVNALITMIGLWVLRK